MWRQIWRYEKRKDLWNSYQVNRTDQRTVLRLGQHQGLIKVKGHAFKLSLEAYLCVFLLSSCAMWMQTASAVRLIELGLEFCQESKRSKRKSRQRSWECMQESNLMKNYDVCVSEIFVSYRPICQIQNRGIVNSQCIFLNVWLSINEIIINHMFAPLC